MDLYAQYIPIYNDNDNYTVYVSRDEKHVVIYENLYENVDEPDSGFLARFRDVDRVFVDSSAGSAILIKPSRALEYIYINGDRIYVFTTDSEIVAFYSTYAITHNRIYLFLINEYLLIENIDEYTAEKIIRGRSNPYEYYLEGGEILGQLFRFPTMDFFRYLERNKKRNLIQLSKTSKKLPMDLINLIGRYSVNEIFGVFEE